MRATLERLVDETYTPGDEASAEALGKIEWLIGCNFLPGPTLTRMLENGLWTSKDEIWMSFIYVMGVRGEIMAKGRHDSVYPGLIPSTKEVAAFCR